MRFDPQLYGAEVAAILSLDGNGQRLMPLAGGSCSSDEARRRIQSRTAEDLFRGAHAPLAAVAGLYLYFSCLEEAHRVAQDIATQDGSYWHGIMHRQEPDPGNAVYWFGRVRDHPIFAGLLQAASEIAKVHPEAGISFSKSWDPVAFIGICEKARHEPGTALEILALEIQRVEWQLLFAYCASPMRRL